MKVKDVATFASLDLPYTVQQRMEHIERCLFWKGELQRADIVDRFGVNPAQAAADFSAYMAIAPGNMEYNKSRKRYLPLNDFVPRFISPASLDEFVGVISPAVDVETWPMPTRTTSSETLQAVVKAIRQRESIEVRYQSMTDPKPSWRWLSPHAFASDGERWHVRAFCHRRTEFRDFVLGRIIATRHTKPSGVSANDDADWNSFVTVVLKPNPDLSEEQQIAVAAEYTMPRSRELKIRLRRSMLFYLNARFSSEPSSAAAAHQVVIMSTQ